MKETPLVLPELPDFPQLNQLPSIVSTLWSYPEVQAVWLGGSFAKGTADHGSDVDIRAVVDHDAVDNWVPPDRPLIFGDEYVDGQVHDFVGNGILHHFIGASGTLYDLWILDSEKDLPSDDILLLACRNEAVAARISAIRPVPAFDPKPANPSTIRRVVVDYWITTSKDVKVLNRGLELVVNVGLEVQRAYLLRLWYALATGCDTGTSRATIHLLSRMIPPIQGLVGARMNELIGAPARSIEEIKRSIMANRDEVSRIGRLLAEKLGFDYPEKLESVVRSQWH